MSNYNYIMQVLIALDQLLNALIPNRLQAPAEIRPNHQE